MGFELIHSFTSQSIIPEILIIGGSLLCFICKMKIFSWVRSKLRGNDNTIKPEPHTTLSHDHMMHQPCKEGEFSGSSSTLLAIGTFGNNLKDSDNANTEESLPSCNYDDDEEADEELRLLLNEHFSLDSRFSGEPTNYRDEEINVDSITDEAEDEDALVQRRGKQVPSDTRRNDMYKKSLSFLLKKALLCGGGFVPSPVISPVLKDPFPDRKLDNSRMEKILKAMLRKKKYPLIQRYLDMPVNDNDEEQGQTSNGETDFESGVQEQMTLLQPKKVKFKSSRYLRR